MILMVRLKVKRIYDRYEISDGRRILIDRLWPRGVRRSTPNVDLWLKEVAPSNELRKWYAHDSRKWKGFRKRYLNELANDPAIHKALEKLILIVQTYGEITLLYASKEREYNNAMVLKEVIDHTFGLDKIAEENRKAREKRKAKKAAENSASQNQ